MTSPEMTVGKLIDLLSSRDPKTPVFLAMNPFFPMAHWLEQVVQSVDETGRPVVYLAEGSSENTQLGHLPPEVAVALTWQGPIQAPPPRSRRRVSGN
ncbi:hypothetical protein [Streptomyces acidiscabies]|uniref:Uncharacterized protein n=1 Tax=Streptomyces acidiscabies TaxID=42234 RepID=A0AAP6BGN2_9ACTN|nr:hypothetical protein [Streptomyces acidiscabies]MBP5935390.1 hypothetical protein [Streptomyces sp. LBUM 1476]MBZ3916762.1 hypothetical protein [Streptomyces acidiscabies]MDX2964362.1 hypothetical protein [Streptomyces acidiscabies]MDX3024897.1 hypothetical protein [Streptomyces acidiscabies]MDX3794185.1 hypothetical protein [Streptomyces acidiscabies]